MTSSQATEQIKDKMVSNSESPNLPFKADKIMGNNGNKRLRKRRVPTENSRVFPG
jgi:hypothetical protein